MAEGRGRRFPPIKLQETKSSASWPFTVWLKSIGPCNLKWFLFEKGNGLSKKVWIGHEWKPKLWSRGRQFFFPKKIKKIIDKILVVRIEGLVWARNKVACSFEFGLWAWPLEASHYGRPSREAVGVHGQRFRLWAWPLEASHYTRPKAPLTIFYWLFSAHFFGLSTKFGHSIPRVSRLGRP
jgi:hypothetical protein